VFASPLQTCEQLRFVDVQKPFDSFQFDYNLVCNNQIETLDASCIAPFVNDGQFDLCFERNSAQAKFLAHKVLLDRIQQSRTELPVDLNRCADNSLSERVGKKSRSPPCLRGRCSSLPHRNPNALLLRERLRLVVPSICMPNNPHARIGRKHTLDALGHHVRSVGHEDLACVQRVADADSAAVVH
jgi:hypothetical protein